MYIWIESAKWYSKDAYVLNMQNLVLPYISKVQKPRPELRHVCVKHFGVPYMPYMPYMQHFTRGKRFWFVLRVSWDKTFGISMRSILAKKRCLMRAISYKYQQKLTSILRAIHAKKNWLVTAKQTKSNNLMGKEWPEIVSVKCLSLMEWTIHRILFTFISREFK